MQKIGILTLLVMATVLFMLAFPVAAAGPNPPATPIAAAPASPAAPAAASAPLPEKHPHIDEAIEHMQAAKHELEIAAHDFKGHRVKSLEHLNQAIGEAEMCLKADRD